MVDEPGTRRYSGLRVLLGAMVTVAVAIAIIASLYRWHTYWTTPAIVQVPQSPLVQVGLEEHPRLCVTNEAIEALAVAKDSDEYVRIMAKAEQFYGEYLVDPLRGDTIYPGYFALGWRISGEQRYLDAARDMVLVHCRFPRWRRSPESSNFYKIELAYAVGLAYDLLYDQFSESEKRKIEANLSEVLDGLLWHLQGNPSRPFWYDAPHSNYYVAQHSAAGLLAICLGDKYTGVAGWENALAFAYDGLQPSIEKLKADGGWIEGLTYLDFCWGQHGIFFLNALRVNNGPNRLEEDWYETSVRFALAGILPSGREQVNFGDNSSDPISSFGYLWRARAFFDSPFLDEYTDRYLPEPYYPRIPLDSILMQAMLEYDPGLPLGDFPEPGPCQYFPGIEWAMLREDWTNPKGFFLAAKAGYGGWDHNHVDQGTFILACEGVTFINDLGKGDFSEREDPSVNFIYGGPGGHSVFLPSGGEEDMWTDFTMYSENARYRQADADITDWVDGEFRTSFVMTMGDPYPSYGDVKWERHIEWLKPGAELPGGAVLVFDVTNADGHIHFPTSMDTGPRREGITIYRGASSLRAHFAEYNELGIYCAHGSMITDTPEFPAGAAENSRLKWISIEPVSNGDGSSGEYISLTVFLPRDRIAEVVCEGVTENGQVGSFVDGYRFMFGKNEDGEWEFSDH